MKALLLTEYKKMAYVDVAEPVCGPEDVLIQVRACGICGSDIHGYDGSTGRRIPPLVMGHEAAGVITGVGAQVNSSAETRAMETKNRLQATVTPRVIFEKSFAQSISNQAIATPAMIDRYWELHLYPGNRRATVQRFGQYSGDDGAAAKLPGLKVPTLILWGREDKLIPVSVASWFNQQIPGSRVSILDGIGHIPMEEAPDRSLAPVLELLAATGPQTPSKSA